MIKIKVLRGKERFGFVTKESISGKQPSAFISIKKIIILIMSKTHLVCILATTEATFGYGNTIKEHFGQRTFTKIKLPWKCDCIILPAYPIMGFGFAISKN